MRFRNFVRLVSTSGLGLMSLHMWINYIYTHTSPESRLLLAPSLGRRRLLRERIGLELAALEARVELTYLAISTSLGRW